MGSKGPGVLAKIKTGGDEGVQAMLSLINDVGQQAYARAAFASTQIVDQGLGQYDRGNQSRLPDSIKKFTVSELNSQANPALKHPAVAPIVGLLEQQFQKSFPHATAAELTAHVQQYLQEVGNIVTSGKAVAAEKANPTKGDEDWTGFFQS